MLPTPDLLEDRTQEGRKHILVINDSRAFLTLMREVLQNARCNVTTTNFVSNALAHIAALQPDTLIIDVVIGKQAGWELLERLHANLETSGIPMLLVSSMPQLLGQAREQVERTGTHHALVSC